MLIWFPAYQFMTLFGLAAGLWGMQAVDDIGVAAGLNMEVMAVVGLPVLLNLYLACLLFAVGSFGALLAFGVPLTGWVRDRLNGLVEFFR